MAEEVKRMRKERLKRTRQFRGDVILHQESVQESVDRSRKEKNNATVLLMKKHTHLKE